MDDKLVLFKQVGSWSEHKEALYLHQIQTVSEAVSLAQRTELQPKMFTETTGETKRTEPALKATPMELLVTPAAYLSATTITRGT